MTDECIIGLIQGSKADFLSTLPEYQRLAIDHFLNETNDPLEAAARWLAASGPAQTAPFAAQKPGSVYLEKVLDEVEGLLCGGSKYKAERAKLLGELKPGQLYLVGSISTAIGPHVGAAAAFIAPVIALVLIVVVTIGTNAWCAMRKEARASLT